jgi:SAM-dependent MidA family methyltransferase
MIEPRETQNPSQARSGAGRAAEDAASPLAERLRRRILREGPITFHDWMRAALYDEREGYYRRADAQRWGRAGDYRTSPERSRLFSATFARYFAAVYEELGRPTPFHLVEAGGGAGHFAAGVLQTLERDAPRAFAATRYHFVETSEDARRRAAALLSAFSERIEFCRLEEHEAPLDSCVVFSNELIDAFPVHRVVWRGGRLGELCVGLDARGRFIETVCEPSTPALAAHFEALGVTPSEGQAIEVNLEAENWLALVGRSLGRGMVVTVDYGDDAESLFRSPARREGTLRAFRRHNLAPDALADPGEQDLTSTVNWTHLVAAGERVRLRRVSLERQDEFLLRVGLLEQLERESALARDGAEVTRLRLDAREMVLPDRMGARFQVLIQRKIDDWPQA